MIPLIRETFIIKAFLLLFLMVQFAILYYLYKKGNQDVCPTPFMKSLTTLLFHLALLFCGLAITPMIGIGNVEKATMFSNYCTWVFILPVIIAVWRFTDESMNVKNGKKPFKKKK